MRTGLLYGPVQEDLARVEATFESLKQVDYAPLADMLGNAQLASLCSK